MSGTDLIVTCHPSATSLCWRVAEVVEEVLGKEAPVVVDNLACIAFSPIMSPEELQTYYQDYIPDDVQTLVAHLRQAHRIIFVLPIWMYDMPALLKGYFDRVWRPYVAYRMDGERISPLLTNIKRMVVIVTHGRSEAETLKVGDATRQFFGASLPILLTNLESNVRFDFYSLDTPNATLIAHDLDIIRKHFAGANCP
jgi:NAD(P)H dehydrogenase (quinone)